MGLELVGVLVLMAALASDASEVPPPSAAGDSGVFAHGYCAEYAVALHRLYGHDLGIVWEEAWDQDDEEWYGWLAHAFVYDRAIPGNVMDVRGSRPMEEMLSEICHAQGNRIRVEPITEQELDNQSMEGLLPEVVQSAMQYIRQTGKKQ